MSSCLVIQHLAAEGPYAIAEALIAAGVEVNVVRVDTKAQLPATLDGFAGLVVMGGPMSAASDEGFLTRADEIALMRDAIEREMPLLGVCLGAQLLAVAAGGLVTRGQFGLEVGWGPISLDSAAKDDPLLSELSETISVLHWHGDTYSLPPGAIHLASSARYFEQAFRIGSSAWGLQFHLEVDESAVDAFVENFSDDAHAAGTTPTAIRSSAKTAISAFSPFRNRLLARFAEMTVAYSATQARDEPLLNSLR